MSPRPTFTLLLVQRGFVARADFRSRRAPRLLSLQREVLAADESLPERVAAAARLAESPARHAWVLSDELCALTVQLDARAVRGLDRAALEKALAYEAQTVSGLAAGESLLASSALPAPAGARRFWVAQIARADMGEIDHALRDLGCDLRGVLHPLGVPTSLASPPAVGPWCRSELWPDHHCLVDASTGEAALLIDRPDPMHSGSKLDASRVTETLQATGPGASTLPHASSLHERAVLERFLCAWAEVLTHAHRRVPVLLPESLPTSRRILVAGALTLLTLVAALAFLDLRRLRQAGARAHAATVVASEPRERVRRLEAEVQALEAEIERTSSIPSAAAPARPWSGEVLPLVLRSLAAFRPPGLLVVGLELSWGRLHVRGLAVEANAADRLSGILAGKLGAHGYEARPATQRLRAEAGAPLYEFAIDLRAADAGVRERRREEVRDP